MSQPTKLKVFLSYSRKDEAFVIRLAAALAKQGYDVEFDQSQRDPVNVESGISAEDEWWRRLQEMIAASAVVVFVVSPDSAASRVCDEEIAFARAMGKRLIPILLRQIDFATAPPRLAALNVKLSFAGETAFDASLAALSLALDTDVAWLREGAHLTSLALRWDSEGKPESRLLPPAACAAAETWATKRPFNAPVPAEILEQFIDASRARNRMDRDRLLTITGRAFVGPAETALAEGRIDAALRLCAAGVVLGEDPDMELVPERQTPIALGAERQALYAIAHGHDENINSIAYSPDGALIVSGSRDAKACVWATEDGRAVCTLAAHTSAIFAVAFSPDSRLVLTASNDGTARLWEIATGKCVHVFSHAGQVVDVCFSHSGNRALTGSADGTAGVWDVQTGVRLRTLDGHGGYVSNLLLSRDGRRLAMTTGSNNTVRIWDLANGKLISELTGHTKPIVAMDFSPDDRFLATASRDGTARTWAVDKGSQAVELARYNDRVSQIAYSSDGQRVFVACLDGQASIRSSADGSIVATFAGHKYGLMSATLSEDGKRALTAGLDGTARIWDAATGAQMAVFTGHDGEIGEARFAPDGRRFATAGWDGTLRLWDAACGRDLARMKAEGSSINAVAACGDRVATAASEPVVRVWDASAAKQQHALIGHASEVHCVAFDPSGHLVASGSADGAVRLSRADTGAFVHELKEDGPVRVVTFSPDGGRLMTTSRKAARIWDVGSGKIIAVLQGHTGDILTASFHPKADRAVTGGEDFTARVWDLTTGRTICVMEGHIYHVVFAEFDANGSRIITGAIDNWVKVWNAGSGELVQTLRGHEQGIQCGALSPDRTVCVTGSREGGIRSWNVAECREQAVMAGHTDIVKMVAFSSDGTRVVTASDDRTARVWNVRTGALMARFNDHVGQVTGAVFCCNDDRIASIDDTGELRLWSARQTRVAVSDAVEVLAASLTRGRGRRSSREQNDLLLRSAPDDLLEALRLQMTPEQWARVEALARLQAGPSDQLLYLPRSARPGL